ncbi:MAG: HAMP domain-containing protein [Alphaproteobacteria bacterium]|nr:HAMP domain-containing protein [Alphaproteobacteria bacterium]
MFLSLNRKIIYSIFSLFLISTIIFSSTFYVVYSSKIEKDQQASITRNTQYTDLLHRNVLLIKELRDLAKKNPNIRHTLKNYPQIKDLVSDTAHTNFLANEQKNITQRTKLFDEGYQTIYQGTTIILFNTVLLSLFIIFIGYLFNRWVLIPINTISTISEEITKGNLHLRIPARKKIKYQDELDRFSSIFNQMLDNIENMISTIKDKENFLQSLIDNIPDGIRVIDEKYNIVIANKAYYKQSSDTPKQAQKCYASSFCLKQPCINEQCPMYEILQKGKERTSTIQQFASNPGKYLSVNAALMQYDKSHRYVVEAIRDLSDDIDFSHQQKITSLGFLSSSIAHEIKNNLGALRIILEHIIEKNVLSKNTDKEHKRLLQTLHNELVNTINIPERLLKMTRYASQEETEFDCITSLGEIIQMLDFEAKRKGIFLEFKYPKKELLLQGNETDFKIAVINIIQNAINATDHKGSIDIKVSSSQKNGITISFTDTGVGIAEEDIEYIFTPFYSQGQQNKDSKTAGSGLGLPITKSIVEKFGGQISVKSKIGEGTNFTLSFPTHKKTCNKTKQVL